jgi:glucose/arabinose dehydrogenase
MLPIMKPFHRTLMVPGLILIFSSASCQNIPEKGTLVPFVQGVNKPVCIANAGDSRLFVVEQPGYIRCVDTTGTIYPVTFLDIHERVKYGGEEGLLGVAFHPQYGINGYFYVNYIGVNDSTHISRFQVSSANPDVADAQSEFKLMTIYQPFTNHKGGDLNFGPDGYLYFGLGDGGSAGDPDNRAQNLMDYHGKLLRIDVNQGNPYTIPPTNPFYDSSSALGEIWAFGLRNPWRFSFDRLTGDLWIADVGQNLIEEIDFQSAASTGGENYGWRCYEGNQEYNTAGCPAALAFTFPIYTYPHSPECSVTGGYVFRGSSLSPYYGYYFFADYCSDRIWTLRNASGSWVAESFGQFPGNNFSTFGEDVAGQLYIAGLTTGTIYRVVENSAGISGGINTPGINVLQVPHSNIIRIETGRNDRPGIHISLYDLKGTEHYQTTRQEGSFEFDPGALPTGTYLLELIIDGKKQVRKIVVSR